VPGEFATWEDHKNSLPRRAGRLVRLRRLHRRTAKNRVHIDVGTAYHLKGGCEHLVPPGTVHVEVLCDGNGCCLI
jgi:hypothetical protein